MTDSPEWNLTETDKGREYWLSRPYVDDEIRPALAGAGALLVPEEGFRDVEHPLFRQGAGELLKFLRSHGVQADICITDEQYRELSLNFDVITLGTILVSSIALPVVADLLSTYIQKKFEEKRAKSSNIEVRLLIEASDPGKSRTLDFSYRGPAEDLGPTLSRSGVTSLLDGVHSSVDKQGGT